MKKSTKTKTQLLEELAILRQQLAERDRAATHKTHEEAALRRSEAFYRSLVESSPEVIYSLSPQDGTFTSLNPAFEKITGWPRAEWLGRSFIPLIHPDDVPKAIEMFRRTINGETPPPFELRVLSHSGDYLVGEIIVPQIQHIEQGKLVDAFGFTRDITKRKRAEEALQQEAAIAAALAHVGQEMISSLNTPVLLNRLGQLTTEVLACDYSQTLLWKPESEAYLSVSIYGATAEQEETLRVLTIPRHLISSLLTRLRMEEVLEGTAEADDFLTPTLASKCGVASILYLALRRGAEIIGIQIAGYRDPAIPFTPQRHRIALGVAQLASMALENARLLEQAEHANRLKSDFLATMSHELRTPLNIIMGYSDLLLSGAFGDLTDEQTNILKRVDRNANELFELITTTLDVGRLESGRVPLQLQLVDLPALIAEIAAETQEQCQQKGLRFSSVISPHLPQLETDPLKLKVVIKNLLGNAVKFTETGSVSVAAHPHNQGIEICVSDTGIGIAPEAMALIFEPFRQLENHLTRRHSGVGLGLYIVRRMLELLGGTVEVESVVGRGSTFRMRLPTTIGAG
jgi:PAS domain S-box-containing protein